MSKNIQLYVVKWERIINFDSSRPVLLLFLSHKVFI